MISTSNNILRITSTSDPETLPLQLCTTSSLQNSRQFKSHQTTSRKIRRYSPTGLFSRSASHWSISLIFFIVCFSSQSASVFASPAGRSSDMTGSSKEAELVGRHLGSGSGSFSENFGSPSSAYFQVNPNYGPLDETAAPSGELAQLQGQQMKNSDRVELEGYNPNIDEEEKWEMVLNPKFFIQTERESSIRQQRKRRNAGPSLSIVNPLDVLRQRLLIEIARRRFHSKNQQIQHNTEYLKTIGRRRR